MIFRKIISLGFFLATVSALPQQQSDGEYNFDVSLTTGTQSNSTTAALAPSAMNSTKPSPAPLNSTTAALAPPMNTTNPNPAPSTGAIESGKNSTDLVSQPDSNSNATVSPQPAAPMNATAQLAPAAMNTTKISPESLNDDEEGPNNNSTSPIVQPTNDSSSLSPQPVKMPASASNPLYSGIPTFSVPGSSKVKAVLLSGASNADQQTRIVLLATAAFKTSLGAHLPTDAEQQGYKKLGTPSEELGVLRLSRGVLKLLGASDADIQSIKANDEQGQKLSAQYFLKAQQKFGRDGFAQIEVGGETHYLRWKNSPSALDTYGQQKLKEAQRYTSVISSFVKAINEGRLDTGDLVPYSPSVSWEGGAIDFTPVSDSGSSTVPSASPSGPSNIPASPATGQPQPAAPMGPNSPSGPTTTNPQVPSGQPVGAEEDCEEADDSQSASGKTPNAPVAVPSSPGTTKQTPQPQPAAPSNPLEKAEKTPVTGTQPNNQSNTVGDAKGSASPVAIPANNSSNSSSPSSTNSKPDQASIPINGPMNNTSSNSTNNKPDQASIPGNGSMNTTSSNSTGTAPSLNNTNATVSPSKPSEIAPVLGKSPIDNSSTVPDAAVIEKYKAMPYVDPFNTEGYWSPPSDSIDITDPNYGGLQPSVPGQSDVMKRGLAAGVAYGLSLFGSHLKEQGMGVDASLTAQVIAEAVLETSLGIHWPDQKDQTKETNPDIPFTKWGKDSQEIGAIRVNRRMLEEMGYNQAHIDLLNTKNFEGSMLSGLIWVKGLAKYGEQGFFHYHRGGESRINDYKANKDKMNQDAAQNTATFRRAIGHYQFTMVKHKLGGLDAKLPFAQTHKIVSWIR